MWYLRRLLRVSWSAKRSNQSILNIHGRNYVEAEAPIFGHLMQKANSLEKTLMLGKIECRRRGWQRTSCLESITNSVAMSFSKLWEMVKDREAWDAAVHGVTKSWMRPSDWTELNWSQEEKGMTEDEMVVWNHQLNEHGFEQALGDDEGQGSLACWSLWGCKELDMTKWLNNNSCNILKGGTYIPLRKGSVLV